MSLITNDAIMQHFGYPGAVNDKVRAFFNTWYQGSGSPEGVVSAAVGSFYLDTLNGALYAKQSGSGNTGWIAGIASGSGSGPYVPQQPTLALTYNADGTVATMVENGVTSTFTYNANGTVATVTRSGVTRTYSYNADGTVSGVA